MEEDAHVRLTALCIDDSQEYGVALVRALRSRAWRAEHTEDLLVALQKIAARACDLVLLDWRMPAVSGADALKALRVRAPELPVLVLTAADELRDRLAAFHFGADDYILKTAHLDELCARMRVALRRAGRAPSPLDDRARTIAHAGLYLNLELQRATTCDGPISLTPAEFRFLVRLVDARGGYASHAELACAVFDPKPSDPANSLRVLVAQLRRKLRRTPVGILTRSGGYALAQAHIDETFSPDTEPPCQVKKK